MIDVFASGDVLVLLFSSVAGKLKNLFLLFAGHFVKNVTTLLTAIHEDNDGTVCLS